MADNGRKCLLKACFRVVIQENMVFFSLFSPFSLFFLPECGRNCIFVCEAPTNLKYKNEPWLYMSIILKDRSIDFEFDDENIIKRWFYGLYHFLYRSKRVYKIASCSSFIIERLRLKLMLKSDLIPSSTSSVSFISSLNKYNRTHKL